MSGDPTGRLWRIARRLHARAAGASRLPPLLFFTDPVRTPDPTMVIGRLPRGAGVVFRAFGRPEVLRQGEALRRLARSRGLVFLVGADAALARALDADGLHLPQRALKRPIDRSAFPTGFLVTVAAHDPAAVIRAGWAGVDASVISPVFPSASSSARGALGTLALAKMTSMATTPVYALGGVGARTAAWLTGTGVAGLAAIEGLIRT